MKRLTTLSFTLMALVLMSAPATAQRGGGRSGSPAGPPPMSERGQMQTHSNKPTRESGAPGSVSRDHETQPKMTASDRLGETRTWQRSLRDCSHRRQTYNWFPAASRIWASLSPRRTSPRTLVFHLTN